MAKPTALTELGNAKMMFLADNTAVTPVARGIVSVQSSTSGDATYPVGWLGIATHRDGDTLTQPGGFTGLVSAAAPVVAVGARVGPAGTTVGLLHTNTAAPGASDAGLVVRNIPSGTQTISGSVTIASGSVTISGSLSANQSVNVSQMNGVAPTMGNGIAGTGVQRVTLASDSTGVVGLVAGAAVVGSVKAAGWDHASVAPQRGLSIGTSNTTENTLLAADASNLYNVFEVSVSAYVGSTATAGAARYLSLRHGVAGTEFLRVYLPAATVDATYNNVFRFTIPDRGSVNNAVTVQLNAAMGTGYQYAVNVHAVKSAT